MDTVSFLRRVLPATGLYIIARHVEGKWRHQVCDTIEEAAAYALQFDSQGVPTYHACAAYRERSVERTNAKGEKYKAVRVQENVRALKAFWMDIDVKPGVETAFQSQEEAVNALVSFVSNVGLPVPMCVSSGFGIHIYWTLTDEISPDQWKQTAEALKALCAHHQFKADQACTSDGARVLRSVGTWNRKDPANPRPVEIISDASDIGFPTFSACVGSALRSTGIKPPEVTKHTASQEDRLNEAFAIQRDFPPCSAHKVADRCQQFRQFRDKRGCISEPHWYASLGVIVHSVEGDELGHTWSSGYAGYSRRDTDRKLQQARENFTGPTTCARFEEWNPGGCAGCPFHGGKITSPAQLGAHVEAAPAPVVESVVNEHTVQLALPDPPWPFTRDAGGKGIFVNEDDVLHKIYDYDCYPIALEWDEQLGYETVRLRHYLPQEGQQECTIRSSLIARPSDFEQALRDNGIRPLSKKHFIIYMDSYMRSLQEATKLQRLFKTMGWKNDDTEFVLGNTIHRKDGAITAGQSRGTKNFLAGFRTKGDPEVWKLLTSAFNDPEFAPQAFLFLQGFVPPLLPLAGRQGYTVSALGDTGGGKTATGMLIASIYGHPTDTWFPRDSTINALYERLGAYKNLPLYTDEITTIDPKDIRDLIYRMPTGKARDRLHQDASAKVAAHWNTVFIASTNESLHGKLQLEKANPEAESMRLFEIDVPQLPEDKAATLGLFWQHTPEHFGHAGPRYIAGLVQHRDVIREQLTSYIDATAVEFRMRPQERFWTVAVALALYGGVLAQQWGLIGFDPLSVKPWLQREIEKMRGSVQEAKQTALEILCEYLNAHVGERLVINGVNESFAGGALRMPTLKLNQRYEPDRKVLYVGRKAMYDYWRQRRINPDKIRKELLAQGVLMRPDARCTLGKGTILAGPVGQNNQTPCWELAMTLPELEAVAKV